MDEGQEMNRWIGFLFCVQKYQPSVVTFLLNCIIHFTFQIKKKLQIDLLPRLNFQNSWRIYLLKSIYVLYLQFPCSRFGTAPCCFVSFEKRKTLLKLLWLMLLEYISVSHYSLWYCHCWMFIISPTSADQFHHLYLSFYFIWIFQYWEHCQFVVLK